MCELFVFLSVKCLITALISCVCVVLVFCLVSNSVIIIMTNYETECDDHLPVSLSSEQKKVHRGKHYTDKQETIRYI